MAILLIVAIAWLYVVLLMAMTEDTISAAIITFLGYGLIPGAICFFILAGLFRGPAKPVSTNPPSSETVDQPVHAPDGSDTQSD